MNQSVALIPLDIHNRLWQETQWQPSTALMCGAFDVAAVSSSFGILLISSAVKLVQGGACLFLLGAYFFPVGDRLVPGGARLVPFGFCFFPANDRQVAVSAGFGESGFKLLSFAGDFRK